MHYQEFMQVAASRNGDRLVRNKYVWLLDPFNFDSWNCASYKLNRSTQILFEKALTTK